MPLPNNPTPKELHDRMAKRLKSWRKQSISASEFAAHKQDIELLKARKFLNGRETRAMKRTLYHWWVFWYPHKALPDGTRLSFWPIPEVEPVAQAPSTDKATGAAAASASASTPDPRIDLMRAYLHRIACTFKNYRYTRKLSVKDRKLIESDIGVVKDSGLFPRDVSEWEEFLGRYPK